MPLGFDFANVKSRIKGSMRKDWQIKKLGEVCDVRDGTHGSPKFYEKGFPLVTSKNLKNGKIELSNIKYISKEDFDKINERSKVDINDILFAMIGTIGNPVLVSEKPNYAIKNVALIKDIGIIYPKYVLYFLSSPIALNKMQIDSKGSTQTFVSLGYLRRFSIPVPPLEEQKRIVAVLDKKFSQIETLKTAAEKNLQNTKQLFQAELKKVFSNTSWEKKLLSDVCLQKQNKKWKDENNNTEYQYIDLSAVDRETNVITETQIITKKTAPSRAQQIVKTDDVLFGTTRPTLKRVCLLSDEYDEQICSTGFCIIRANNKEVTPDWLYYQFFNDAFYKYIEPLQKGASYPAVTDKEVLNYEIPLPPLEEQKRIVAHLDSLSEKVHQLEEIYTKQLADCDELKQSLLQKAFEGEL